MSRDRLHAAEAAAIGGGMIGGASAANHGLDRMLERKGVKPPARAAWHEAKRFVRGGAKTAVHPLHAPFVAGKIATGSVRTVGIPLLAYGAFNMITPGDKVARVRLKDDVVRPTVHTATGVAQAKRAKQRLQSNHAARKRAQSIQKSALTPKEDAQLQRRKQTGRRISQVAGTMGLAALALRAPELARATGKIPRAARIPGLGRIARHEAGATKASNALGIAAIGTGSIGSFNYAAQQKLERKKFAKARIPKPRQLMLPGMPSQTAFPVTTGRRVWKTPTGKTEWVEDRGPAEVAGMRKIVRTHPKTGRKDHVLTHDDRLGPFAKAHGLTATDYRRYMTPGERRRNKAQALAVMPVAVGISGSAPLVALSGLKDMRAARRHESDAIEQIRQETFDRRRQQAEAPRGLGRGPVEVKADRHGVYNIATEHKTPRRSLRPTAGAKSLAGAYGRSMRGGGKLGVAASLPAAGLMVAALNGKATMKRTDKRVLERKRAAEGVTKGLFPVVRPPRIPLAARKPAIRGGHIATSPLGRKFTVRGSVR